MGEIEGGMGMCMLAAAVLIICAYGLIEIVHVSGMTDGMRKFVTHFKRMGCGVSCVHEACADTLATASFL